MMNKLYTISGSVPSKKNSRVNTKTGRSFPSKKYRDWHTVAGLEIKSQGLTHFESVERLEVKCYFKNNIRQDLDNRLSSILDLLVDLNVLKDDCWQVIPYISIEGEIDRENPRTEIRLLESCDD